MTRKTSILNARIGSHILFEKFGRGSEKISCIHIFLQKNLVCCKKTINEIFISFNICLSKLRCGIARKPYIGQRLGQLEGGSRSAFICLSLPQRGWGRLPYRAGIRPVFLCGLASASGASAVLRGAWFFLRHL